MKKVKITLTGLAFVAGIGGAFATKMINSNTAWFYVDANGDPTGSALITPDCDQSTMDLCAKQYNVDQNQQPISETGITALGRH